MLSLYGKLPTAGDFLAIEMPRALLRPVEDWLASGTAAARAAIGGEWQTVFDAGGTWFFWIGERVLGRRMAGVLCPSRDKVGRRFPVMLFASSDDPDEMPDAPVLEEGEELYDGLAEELDYLAGLGPEDISQRLKAAATTASDPDPKPSFFWAVAPRPGPDGWRSLLDEARYADHAMASARRSYWWQPAKGGNVGAMLAADGLPEPANFIWFVTGVGAGGFANQPESA